MMLVLLILWEETQSVGVTLKYGTLVLIFS